MIKTDISINRIKLRFLFNILGLIVLCEVLTTCVAIPSRIHEIQNDLSRDSIHDLTDLELIKDPILNEQIRRKREGTEDVTKVTDDLPKSEPPTEPPKPADPVPKAEDAEVKEDMTAAAGETKAPDAAAVTTPAPETKPPAEGPNEATTAAAPLPPVEPSGVPEPKPSVPAEVASTAEVAATTAAAVTTSNTEPDDEFYDSSDAMSSTVVTYEEVEPSHIATEKKEDEKKPPAKTESTEEADSSSLPGEESSSDDSTAKVTPEVSIYVNSSTEVSTTTNSSLSDQKAEGQSSAFRIDSSVVYLFSLLLIPIVLS